MKKNIIILVVSIIVLAIVGGGFYWWKIENKKPKTYSEVFSPPIDPNKNPVEHKAVYEKVQKIVHFPILYPEKLPEGWKLVSVDATEGSKIDKGRYYGMNTITYEDKEKKQKIQIMEGLADLGIQATSRGVITLNGAKEGWLWQTIDGGLVGITYSDKKIGADYIVTGVNISQEEIVKIANLLIEVK